MFSIILTIVLFTAIALTIFFTHAEKIEKLKREAAKTVVRSETNLYKKISVSVAALTVVVLLATSVVIIKSGDIGVRILFGTVSMEEVQAGLNIAVYSTIDKYSSKEIQVDLDNLQPKAKDNLSLADMDVSVYYKVIPEHIAELTVKYAGQSGYLDYIKVTAPLYHLVYNTARSAVYTTISEHNSLVMHTQRDKLEMAIKDSLQTDLASTDNNSITITRVVIRNVKTDESIEASIRNAVAKEKELDAIHISVKIASESANIEIAKARGVATANAIIQKTLTREYLQHETNQVLLEFAKGGKSNTIIIPANMQVAPLINIPSNH